MGRRCDTRDILNLRTANVKWIGTCVRLRMCTRCKTRNRECVSKGSTRNIGSTETLSSTARVPAAAPDNMYILFNLGLHTRLIDIVNCVIGLCHIHSYVIQSMSETPRADCADTDARDGSFNGPGEES